MKLKNKLLSTVAALAAVAAVSVSAFAAAPQTHAEILANLTGRTVEDVVNERAVSGKTYGTLASEAGKLDEFRAACGVTDCDGTAHHTGGAGTGSYGRHHGGSGRHGGHGGCYYR